MLTLSRKVGESLRIGPNVRVIVRAIRGQQVQISIEAPTEVGVYREEIYEAIRHANLAAASNGQAAPRGAEDKAPHGGGKGGKVMKVESTRFGAIDVPTDSVVEFPEGLVGLHDYRRFVLIERPNSPMRWMQSLDTPELAFLVADPQVFVNEYNPQIPAAELTTICNDLDVQHLAVGVICTVPGDPQDATVNLRAPLVVDVRSRRGKQVVLNYGDYSVHHPWAERMAA